MTTKDLIDLIHQNTRVILPEFGAFLIKESGEKGFIPSNLTFSPFLRYNDGMVEVYIAKSKGVSKDEASKLLHSFIDQIKNELEEKGLFQIEDLGFLKRDSRGSTTFVLSDGKKQPKTEEKKLEPPVQPLPSPTKPAEKTEIIEEKKDPWADETPDEPRVEPQKKFRRISGKRAQVEKLTISRIPINKDVLNSMEGKDGETTQEQEVVRSMFVPVESISQDNTITDQEEIKPEVDNLKSEETVTSEPSAIEEKPQESEVESEIVVEPVIEKIAEAEIPEEVVQPTLTEAEIVIEEPVVPKPKKGRGRKKKVESEIIEKIEDVPIEKSEEIQIVSDETLISVSATEGKGELIELEAATEPEKVVESPVNIEEISANEVVSETPTSNLADEKEPEQQKSEVKKPIVYERYEDDSSSSILITIGVIVGVVILFFVGKALFFSSKSELAKDSLTSAQTIINDSLSAQTLTETGSEDEIDKAFNELDNSEPTAENQDAEVEKEQRKTEDAIAQEVIKSTPKPVVDGVKYYLIVGSFKNLNYAKGYADKISKSGLKAEIVLQKSGMHAVSIGAYKTRTEAADKQAGILDKYPGAWILKQ